MRNLTALAAASVGFDAARGDLLQVEDLAFEDNRIQTPVTVPAQILAAAEGSPILIKYGVLLLSILVVVVFGVRPALRHARLASYSKATARELPAPGRGA